MDSRGYRGRRMGLFVHLRELRRRLLAIAVCFTVALAVCLWLSEAIAQRLAGLSSGFAFVYISPAELVMVYMRLGVIGALVVVSPVILYQLWAFVCPGLTPRERRLASLALLLGLLLFCGGVAFAYQFVVPFMLRFFAEVDSVGNIAPMISFSSYITFVLRTLATFGVVFEMPVVSILLTRLGLLRPDMMADKRRYVVLAIFVIAAVLTPPDVVSQVMVAVPMMGLYEMSIAFCRLLAPGRAACQQDAGRLLSCDKGSE